MRRLISLVLVVFICLNLFLMQSFAANENTYSFVRLDDGTGNILTGIANVGDTIVVTSNGKIIVSKDAGDTWNEKTLPGAITLRQICSDGTRFVSLDSKGKIYVSMDGETWGTSVSVWNSTVTVFDYDGSYFYIGYTDGKLFRSVDGTTWSKLSDNIPSGACGIAVNYNTNQYVFNIDNSSTVKYTSDFKVYKDFIAGDCNTSYKDIIYSNGQWYFSILHGKIATSKDLVSTSKAVSDFQETCYITNSNFRSILMKFIRSEDKVYVLGFLGKIRNVTDISDVKRMTSEIRLSGRTRANMEGFVKIGDSFVSYSRCGEIFKNTNDSWKRTYGSQSLAYQIDSIPERKSVLALANNNAILLSDGKVTGNEKINLRSNNWDWEDNSIKVKGESWYTATSTDFKNWTVNTDAANDFAAEDFTYSKKTDLVCISTSKDVFVFDSSRGYYSLTKLPLNPNFIDNIDNDVYIVGNGGVGLKISDKLKRTAFNVNKQDCIKIIKANGTYVILHKNSISTSKDLKTWSTTKISDSYALNDITYDDKNGIFVIACSNGTLLTSKDLKSWYITELNLSVSAYGVAAYNGYVYVVAQGGVILASEKLAVSNKKAVVSQLKIDNKEITVFVENNKLILTQKPYVEKGITMVPLNDVVTALGGTAEAKNGAINVSFNNTTIELKANSDKAVVNGKASLMGAKVKYVGSTAYVPVQFVSNQLKCNLYIEGFSNTIYISRNL